MKFDKSISSFMQKSNEAVETNLALVDRLFSQYNQITECIDNVSSFGLTPATERIMRSLPDTGHLVSYSFEQIENAKPAVRDMMALEGFFEILGDIVSKIFNAIIAVFQWIISMIGKVISYIFGGVAAAGGLSGRGNNSAEGKALTKKLEDIFKVDGTKLVGDLPTDMESIEKVLTTINSLSGASKVTLPNPIDTISIPGLQGAFRITIPGYEKNRKFVDIILPGKRVNMSDGVTDVIMYSLPNFLDEILREWNTYKVEHKTNNTVVRTQNKPYIDNTTGAVSNKSIPSVTKNNETRSYYNLQDGIDSLKKFMTQEHWQFAKLYTALFTALFNAQKSAAGGGPKMVILPMVDLHGNDVSGRIEDEVDRMLSSYVDEILRASVDKKNSIGNILSKDSITANKGISDPTTAGNVDDTDYLNNTYNNVIESGRDAADIKHYGVDTNKYLASFTRLYTLIGDPTDTNRYRFAGIKQALEDIAKTQEQNRELVEKAKTRNEKVNNDILLYLKACIEFASREDALPPIGSIVLQNAPDGYDDVKLKMDIAHAYATSINIRHISKFLNVYYTTIQKLIKLTTVYTARYQSLIKTIQDTQLANIQVGGQEVPLHSTK